MSKYFSLSLASGKTAYPNLGQDHDIWFESGILQSCYNSESVAQRVRQKLEYYEGEWFLNQSNGVPWFSLIYTRPFNQDIAESILEDVILDTEGVVEITEFNVNIDLNSRGFGVKSIKIKTIFDEEVSV